jgi:hypothetical protein
MGASNAEEPRRIAWALWSVFSATARSLAGRGRCDLILIALRNIEPRPGLGRKDRPEQPEKGHEDSDNAKNGVTLLERQPAHGKETDDIEGEENYS